LAANLAVNVMHALASRRVVTKPWGKTDVGVLCSEATAQFTAHGQPIGEVWFEPNGSDVLVKYLFTSERLSIQVHPDDDLARSMQAERGKDECWLILEAEPDAHYGIGLTHEMSIQELRAAALDGSVVDLVDWRAARVGDFIFNPSRTVHALGPGLTVLEVQQNSDVTLRLFDYFSKRPVQVDQAVAISRREPHYHHLDRHIDFTRTHILVDGPSFGLAFCRGDMPTLPKSAKDIQLVTWRDAVKVGTDRVPPGSMVRLQSLDEIHVGADQQFFLVWAITPTD
jgi:mannose-6-phosphate isomerase